MLALVQSYDGMHNILLLRQAYLDRYIDLLRRVFYRNNCNIVRNRQVDPSILDDYPSLHLLPQYFDRENLET